MLVNTSVIFSDRDLRKTGLKAECRGAHIWFNSSRPMMESEDELRSKALSHHNQKDTIKKAFFSKIINNYQMSFNIQSMFIFPNLFTNIKKKKA